MHNPYTNTEQKRANSPGIWIRLGIWWLQLMTFSAQRMMTLQSALVPGTRSSIPDGDGGGEDKLNGGRSVSSLTLAGWISPAATENTSSTELYWWWSRWFASTWGLGSWWTRQEVGGHGVRGRQDLDLLTLLNLCNVLTDWKWLQMAPQTSLHPTTFSWLCRSFCIIRLQPSARIVVDFSLL